MLTLETRLEGLARLGRALADPTRCRILLSMLAGPVYPGELARDLGLTRPNVSNHLGCLRGCGIVVGVPEGRQVRYELVDARLVPALHDLLDIALAVQPSCAPATPAHGRRAAGRPAATAR